MNEVKTGIEDNSVVGDSFVQVDMPTVKSKEYELDVVVTEADIVKGKRHYSMRTLKPKSEKIKQIPAFMSSKKYEQIKRAYDIFLIGEYDNGFGTMSLGKLIGQLALKGISELIEEIKKNPEHMAKINAKKNS